MLPAVAGDVVQAGFLRRWAAIFLDQLVLTGGLYLITFVVFLGAGAIAGFDFDDAGQPPAWMIGAYVGAVGLYYLVAALYYSLLESSASQATLGKMALGIKVVDLDGGRLTWPQALARWFAAGLSYLTFYIGFLVAAFTEHKQALHDLLAKTLVVDKWAYTDTPERQQRGLSGCLIAFLIFMALFVALGVLGILAAIAIPAYQDYSIRARAAGVTSELHQAAQRVDENGVCALAWPASPGAPAAPIQAQTLQNGSCQLTGWLRASEDDSIAATSVEWIGLNREAGSTSWTCHSNLAERQLPSICR